MAFVIIEREFEAPFTLEQVYGAEESARWCLRLYDASPKFHFLARDGLRLICVFDAPDAEALRNVTRQMNFSAPEHLWAATFHPAPGLGDLSPDLSLTGELVVVERIFAAPVTFEEVDAIEAEGIACFDLHRVRFLYSFFSTHRTRMLCFYEAPDAEAVRYANRTAGLPFSAVWSTGLYAAGAVPAA